MDAKPTTSREQRSKSPDRKRRHGRSRSRSRERSRRDRDRRHRSRSRDRSPRRGHKRPKRRSRSRSAEPKKVATKEPALKSSPTIGPAPKPEVKESAAVRSIADIFSVSHSPVVVAASKPVSVTIPIKLTELTRGTKEVKRTVDPETTESTPSVNETDSSVTSNLPSAALAPSTSVTPSGIAKVDVGSMKMDILKALAAAKSSIAGFKKPPAPVVAPPAVPITSPEPSMAELPSTQEDQGSVDSATIVNDKVDEADDNDDDDDDDNDDDSNDECFDLSDLRKTAKAGNESDERAMTMEETVVEVPAEEAAPAPSPPQDEAPADEDDDFDMFAADGDDFATRVPNAPARPAILKATRGHCDDSEGYYRPTIGEVLNGEFRVVGNAGKGVFSTVLLCKRIHGDEKTVAIKLIRANDTMREAAQTEIRLLTELQVGHKAKYIVKLLSTFEHRNHTAMVFEPMQMNVREAMKKFGGRDGLSLRGVKVFCKQLLFGLDHLAKHQVVHADIKPDNMLLDEKQSMVKLCDFGSAFKSTGLDAHDPTPYLVSRFYRAPEIILGLAYDAPVDMWSIGCCIYEMYTGRVMFPGQTNNEMLKLFMEVKGRFPAKLLRRHRAVYVDKFLMEPHFDEELRFISREIDRVTAKPMLRVMNNMNATKDLGTSLSAARAPSDDKKQLLELKDLLDKVFVLDPAKRITVKEALKHPFLQSS